MKMEDIKKLPKEFNFESKINPFGILYHAKETKHGYRVTCDCDGCNWLFLKYEVIRHLLKDDYVLV